MGTVHTIGRKSHALLANVPHTVIMLQQASADNFESVESVDKSLARRGVVREGSNAQFAARDSQVEWAAGLRLETDGYDGGQRIYFAASDTVCARLIVVGFNVR